MQEFDSIEDAFAWFIAHVYPTLKTADKQKVKDVKYKFTHGKTVTRSKKLEILYDYGFEIKIKILYKK